MFKILQLLVIAVFCASSSETGAQSLEGKWSAQRKDENGQVQVRTIEIERDTVQFEIRNAKGEKQVSARGSLKKVELGPFKVMRISNIQMARANGESRTTSEEISLIYTLHEGALVVATNFDEERPGQSPDLWHYKRLASANSAILGSWKLDAKIGDRDIDYTLRIAESEGKLSSVLVSPRSGEYKAKTTSFENNTLKVEVDRQINDNPVTIVITGKLQGQTLSGDMELKGAQEFSGTWTAKK